MNELTTTKNPRGLLARLNSVFSRKVLRTDRSRWNYQYEKGLWDGLENLDELARFSVLAGYVQFLKPDKPAVLEIGCGEGVMARRIGRDYYGSYLGTDVADAAIELAVSRFGDEKTRFEAADMNTFQTDERFDVIIFNEAIYYLKPMLDKLLFQYTPLLKPEGLFIITMNRGRHANSRVRWEQLEKNFTTVDSSFVETAKNSWDIKVLRPRPASEWPV